MLGKHAFTIVEVLVAVTILTVGMLALTTTAALVTRMIGRGRRFTEAAALAANRVEALRAERCPAVGSGTEPHGAFVVDWSVSSDVGERGRLITVLVTSPTARGLRTDTLRTVQACR